MTTEDDTARAEKGIQLAADLLEKWGVSVNTREEMKKLLEEFDAAHKEYESIHASYMKAMDDNIKAMLITFGLFVVLILFVVFLHVPGWVIWFATAGFLIQMLVADPRQRKALNKVRQCETQLTVIAFKIAECGVKVGNESVNVKTAELNLATHNLRLN